MSTSLTTWAGFIPAFLFLLMATALPGQELSVDSTSKMAEAEMPAEPAQPPSLYILSLNGSPVSQGLLEEHLRLQVKGEMLPEWNKVFLNNLPIDDLKPVEGGKGIYQFQLKSTIDGMEFQKLFNIFNEERLLVKLSVGASPEDRAEIGDFTIIIDPYRKLKLIFSLIAVALIGGLLVYAIAQNGLIFLRDNSNLGNQAPFSLARTQFGFWTLIILAAFFYVWVMKGTSIDITGDVLALLGISAATTLGGQLMDQSDIRNPAIATRHQDQNSSGKFFLNIISDSSGVSIHRLQNVVFTIAIAAFFLYSVYLQKQIPDLDNELMILMGISSGTYLAVKSGENKTTAPTTQPGKMD